MIENSFQTVLQNQRKGDLLTEISRAVQEATQAVREQKKQATVILSLTISPANSDASAVQVIDEVKLKLPKPSNPSTLFYTTDENTLSRKDPNQAEMKLEAVPSAAAPISVPLKQDAPIAPIALPAAQVAG